MLQIFIVFNLNVLRFQLPHYSAIIVLYFFSAKDDLEEDGQACV
ncbi:MAG: hypothetical protein WCR12_06760 [Dysgonamonadaceae bacterium]